MASLICLAMHAVVIKRAILAAVIKHAILAAAPQAIVAQQAATRLAAVNLGATAVAIAAAAAAASVGRTLCTTCFAAIGVPVPIGVYLADGMPWTTTMETNSSFQFRPPVPRSVTGALTTVGPLARRME